MSLPSRTHKGLKTRVCFEVLGLSAKQQENKLQPPNRQMLRLSVSQVREPPFVLRSSEGFPEVVTFVETEIKLQAISGDSRSSSEWGPHR